MPVGLNHRLGDGGTRDWAKNKRARSLVCFGGMAGGHWALRLLALAVGYCDGRNSENCHCPDAQPEEEYSIGRLLSCSRITFVPNHWSHSSARQSPISCPFRSGPVRSGALHSNYAGPLAMNSGRADKKPRSSHLSGQWAQSDR